jgi:RNA polymerase sigma factor (sigma-70 family)
LEADFMPRTASQPTNPPDVAGELWKNHKRIAYKVATRMADQLPDPKDLDGLESACLWGLMWAAERHDPDRGAFSTVATIACRRRAGHFLRREWMRGIRYTQGPRGGGRRAIVTPYPANDRSGDERLSTSPIDLVPAPADMDSGWSEGEWNWVLACLPERERRVIRERFRRGKTQLQVSAEMGVSRERVRQIEAVALRSLAAWRPGLELELLGGRL